MNKEGNNMKIKRETTVGKTGGSLMSVIPSILAEILELEYGDKLVWDIKYERNELCVKLSPKKEEE